MNVPSGFTTTTPCAGPVTVMKVNVSPSTSVAVSVPLAGVSSFVVIDWSLATGASLTGVTVIATRPVSVNVPSKTVYSKLAGPWKLAAGVNVIVPSMLSTTVPFTGLLTAVTLNSALVLSTSVSFPFRSAWVNVGAMSSAVVAESFTAIGTSLTGVTVTVTCPVSVPPAPSETV